MLQNPPEISVSPTEAPLGGKLVAQDAAKGRVKLVFDGNAALSSPTGFVSAALDNSMAEALRVMTKGAYLATTTALTVCFLEPVKAGPLIAEGQVVRYGNAVAFLEARLIGADGRLLARATANARLMPARRAVA